MVENNLVVALYCITANRQFAVSEEQAKVWPFELRLKPFDFNFITDTAAASVQSPPASHPSAQYD